jgi:hypothetical protein
MSEADWYFSGCPIGEPDKAFLAAVDWVADLLRSDGGPPWPTLIQTARSLINRSRALQLVPVKTAGSHCSSTRVRRLIVTLIRDRCLTAFAKMSFAFSRLFPAYGMRSTLLPSLVHFSTL